MRSVMLDLGEARALGPKPDGSAWTVGLADRDETLHVHQGAVATSAGSGTVFDRDRRFHHLFDPATGRSAARWRSVTVTAPDATTADALSTAFSVMDEDSIRGVLAGLPGVAVRLT